MDLIWSWCTGTLRIWRLVQNAVSQSVFRFSRLFENQPVFSLLTCIAVAFWASAIFHVVETNTIDYYLFSGAQTDGYFLAGVLWRNDLSLTVPPPLWYADHPSFYYTHVAPFLLLGSLISRIYPTDPTTNAGIFVGALYAGVFVSACYCALAAVQPRSPLAAIALVSLCAPIAVTGTMANVLYLPHWEFAIPALIIVIATALAVGHRAIAWGGLLLCLAVREDAGLHVACWLMPLIVFAKISGKRLADLRTPLAMAVAATGYTLFVMGWTHLVSGADGNFQRVYSGFGVPFEHVTFGLLIERLKFAATHREYVLLPLILLASSSLILWDGLLACGLLAIAPWLLLQIAARHFVAGSLAWYYPFPILAMLCWPFVTLAWRRWCNVASLGVRQSVVVFALLLLSSLYSSQPEVGSAQRSWVLALDMPSYSDRGALKVQDTLAVMRVIRPYVTGDRTAELGFVRINGGVFGLFPESASIDRIVRDMAGDTTYRSADTVIISGFSAECLALDGFIQANQLSRLFHFTGTNIFVLSRFDVAPIFDKKVPIREIRELREAQNYTVPACLRSPQWSPAGLLHEPQIPFSPLGFATPAPGHFTEIGPFAS